MFQFLKGTTTEEKSADFQQSVVTEGQSIFEEQGWGEKYPMLGAQLESSDPQEQWKGAYTATLMRNQAQFIEGAARRYGESFVSSALGDIAPRIMDVVRVFAPNTIAHVVANAQPLSSMTGQVVVVKPQFTNTAAGVTAGQEVFKDQTDGTYASEYVSAALGTGDGSTLTFAATLQTPRASSVSILVDGTSVATDDGSGNISGTGITGTVDYTAASGALSVTWSAAPTAGAVITVTYNANHELDGDNTIRELELGLNVIPVVAEPHPLRLKWSVMAALAATAAINLDVEDTTTVIAGQFLKIERDRQILNYIANLAGAVKASLTFNAVAAAGVSRRDVFNDFVITLAKGENEIFTASGRGSVSWIVCGTTAAVVLKSMAGFVPAASVVPIGAHVIGSIDGVTVIKDPYMTAKDFIVGYNGILPGDSGVIIADWIPVYFTPTEQTASLEGKKALLSMYDVIHNVGTYYARGTIDNV